MLLTVTGAGKVVGADEPAARTWRFDRARGLQRSGRRESRSLGIQVNSSHSPAAVHVPVVGHSPKERDIE